ncbi:hypothetical protein [Vibrio sinensis]|nr:hypothetical protein [Vibrio sinensis]
MNNSSTASTQPLFQETKITKPSWVSEALSFAKMIAFMTVTVLVLALLWV